MKNPDLWKNYSITKVKSHNRKVNHFIGKKVIQNDDGEEYFDILINEIVDREKIELYISDFLSVKQNDPLNILVDCFTDSSKFYVIFRYANKQSVIKYLKKETPSFTTRIELIKTILERLLAYAAYPDIILCSVILPENVLVEEGVDFNAFLDFNLIARHQPAYDVYNNISALVCACFSEKEIEGEPKLSIIRKKLDRSLYASIPQVIRDFDELYRNMTDVKSTLETAKTLRKSFLLAAGKYLLALALILTAASLFKIFSDSKKNVSVYLDTTEIGTVMIKPGNSAATKPAADTYIIVDNKGITPPAPQNPEPVQTPPEISEEPEIPEEQEEPETEDIPVGPVYKEYTVTSGDTLSGISGKFLGDPLLYEEISNANDNIEDPNLIYPGQVLNVPVNERPE